MLLPGIVDRSQFTSDYSSQVAIAIGLYVSMGNIFLPHVAYPCDYILYSGISS